MARTRHYSDFLNSLASLVGIPSTRITTELAASFNTLFNSALKDVWIAAPWHDTCPKGEARFVGNRLTYPNNLAQTGSWTATALTITGNALANPLDGRTTASKLLETAASSEHKAVQSVSSIFASTDYTASVYLRPNGRSSVQLTVNDGNTAHSAFFDVSAGTVGTVANVNDYACIQQPNGYYLCRFTFTASASATTSGSFTVGLSTDGSTVSYAGDTSKGVYVWGALLQQSELVPMNDLIIPWEQTGEEVIETVFNVFQSSPMGAVYPRGQGYELTPDGIQIINGTWTNYVNGAIQSSIYGTLVANPVFVSYRKYPPDFTGTTYAAGTTYAVGDQVYYVDSSSHGNYYKCIVAGTGQTPSSSSAYWQLIPLYNPHFEYCVYHAFADWLISDGQQDKAASMYGIAQTKLLDAIEVQERQMGDVMPTKFQTHVKSRSP